MKTGPRAVIPAVSSPKVVTRQTLGAGTYSNVFPQHAEGGGSFQSGPRNGHPGTATVSSKAGK